jgi:hypothetical protein
MFAASHTSKEADQRRYGRCVRGTPVIPNIAVKVWVTRAAGTPIALDERGVT